VKGYESCQTQFLEKRRQEMAQREEGGVGPLFGVDELTLRRGGAVVDLLYVGLVVLFCVYSLSVPFLGIIVGAILMNVGVSPSSKRVGKACLILGIVSIVFYLILGISLVLLGTLPLLQGFTSY